MNLKYIIVFEILFCSRIMIKCNYSNLYVSFGKYNDAKRRDDVIYRNISFCNAVTIIKQKLQLENDLIRNYIQIFKSLKYERIQAIYLI